MPDVSASLYAVSYEAVVKAASVEEAVVMIRDNYRLDHVTYHHAQIVGDIDAPYVKSTYPAQWLARYLLRGYLHVDPVVREGFSRQLPFDWRELTMTSDARDLMRDAVAHGLGGNGYSIPLVDKQVRRALFSINSNMPLEQWDAFLARHAGELSDLAARIHRMAVAELYGESDPLPQLGPRELECLTWAARGKDYKSIARILSISENTVRDYLKTARLRLDGATIAQAVAKAIRLHLIRP
jgi:DNA-binding CsgD family transcriptional regulator